VTDQNYPITKLPDHPIPDAHSLPPRPLTRSQLIWGLFVVSLASLLLELALTRLFSVVLFYHFAFLAISIALLGLGAGGVFAYVRKQQLERFRTGRLAATLCLMNAAAVLVVLEIVLRLPVSLELTKGNLLKLTVIYLVSAVPFFFTGLLFSVVFAREARTIGLLYGADLIGGAAACLAVVPLLNLVGGPNTIVVAATAMAAAALIWADRHSPSGKGRQKLAAQVAVLVLLALLGANTFWGSGGKLIDIVYAKGIRRDQPWLLWAKWNAISRVEVDQQGQGKTIVIDADAQSAIMNTDPHDWSPDYRKNLMASAPAVANVLRPTGDYAIIGPGGGVDVLRAVANGSPSVTAIEINPLIADDVMRGKYAEYSHHLYELPEVHLHVADGRSWIRNSTERYDVIQMTLVDTWASTAAGAYSLSENNLYTVEAFKEYFQHLKGDGFIAITRWEFKQPREALRVVSEAKQALKALGIKDPQYPDLGYMRFFLVVADGALNEDGRPVTVLAKKSPFTWDEEVAVLSHVQRTPNLFPVYTPVVYRRPEQSSWQSCAECPPEVEAKSDPNGLVPLSASRRVPAAAAAPFAKLIDPVAQYGGEDFVYTYPYKITPVTDNAPFFFFTIRTSDVLKGMFAGTGRGMDWRINMGSVVLFLLLGVSAAAVVAFLILPLALYKPARLHGTRGLWYFVAVGLGYILVEIAFIQRFVLFLGHPTYALTVVVFLMLLASGAGSIFARRWMGESGSHPSKTGLGGAPTFSGDPRRVRWAIGAIAAVIILYLFILPPMLTSLVGLGFNVKLALTALLLVPLGFAMGMPFPTGLQVVAFAGEGSAATEWAWAMNAASSVFGSVLAMVIAINFGLGATLGAGALAYVAALGLTRGWSVPIPSVN
jgi:spermidine synthase